MGIDQSHVILRFRDFLFLNLFGHHIGTGPDLLPHFRCQSREENVLMVYSTTTDLGRSRFLGL